MTNSSTHLSNLYAICQEEWQTYLTKQTGQSEHCLEIVRLAAQGNQDALALLLSEITGRIVASKYRRNNLYTLDDLQQAVYERLVKKFTRADSPYQVQTFAAYHAYVNVTVVNLTRDWQKRSAREPEVITSGQTNRRHTEQKLERKQLFFQLLDLISDPLARDVVRLRYGFEESYDNILVILAHRYPEMTRKQVQRAAEKGLRQLRRHPKLNHIMN